MIFEETGEKLWRKKEEERKRKEEREGGPYEEGKRKKKVELWRGDRIVEAKKLCLGRRLPGKVSMSISFPHFQIILLNIFLQIPGRDLIDLFGHQRLLVCVVESFCVHICSAWCYFGSLWLLIVSHAWLRPRIWYINIMLLLPIDSTMLLTLCQLVK